MAAVTVATVAKKAVEILASNEKGRKFLGYTVGIVIIIVLLPLIALTGLFGFLSSEDFPMDAQQIIAQLPAEDQASIQKIDATGTQISEVFTEKGLTNSDTKKAQAITEAEKMVEDYNDGVCTLSENCSLATADIGISI